MENKEYLDLSVHEIKNILSAISGYSEFIYRGLVDGQKALDMAGKIKCMSEILADFADKKYMYDLLHNHLYHPDYEKINLMEELDMVERDIRMKVHSTSEIQIHCDRTLEIYADRLLIKELMFALLENAVKYSVDETPVEIVCKEEKEEALIQIRNSSMEITREEMERLTDPYYRVDKVTSRKLGGQGFGLAIVREIMELHGCSMSMDYLDGRMNVELRLKINNG